jgi:adenosylcobinamide kinase/adenosylcobinamide-phosphate guanylyltransferase
MCPIAETARITLLLGGARSGKSELAESIAASCAPPVTYVATGWGGDPEMEARIEAHRARRPPEWATVEVCFSPRDTTSAPRSAEAGLEEPAVTVPGVGADRLAAGGSGDLPALLAGVVGTVLVDSLGTWVAAAPGMTVDAGALCAALIGRSGRSILVSDEVGLGVHPETGLGRAFRDVLGELNRAVAAVADEVLLVVAGRVLRLEGTGLGGTGLERTGLEGTGLEGTGREGTGEVTGG